MVALILAIWRVSSLFYDEKGPWDVMVKLREKMGIEHDENGNVIATPIHLEPITCFWCVTLFVAIPLVYFTHHRKCGMIEALELVLAGSAGAILVEKWLGRSKSRLF